MQPSREKKRILFIQCGHEVRRAGFDPELGLVSYAAITPLTAATLAALTPDTYHVDIWDEFFHGTIRDDTPLEHYDIVGISLMFGHLAPQARFLAVLFQLRGCTVVAGGPGISAEPEQFRGFFDALFVNEAERTWPQFLRDYEAGKVQREYRQIEKPSLSETPPPDWRNVAEHIPKYEFGAVQTTRGCPFDCEFCDVIYLFGRKQRHKPVERVLSEVRTLESLGSKKVFFTDDEFVGDPAYARELLSALIPLNNSFRRPLVFFTQVTLTLGRNSELMELMADANFYSMLVGIETFNKDSLKETHKLQNLGRDIVGELRKIQSHGLGLLGSFIVGFDHDGPEIFDTLHEGIQSACLPWVYVGPLTAYQNTKLWARLRAEGRVASRRMEPDEPAFGMELNIIPAGMSRVELLEGYRRLMERLYGWDAINARLRGWLSLVSRHPRVHEEPPSLAVRDRFLEDVGRKWSLSPRELADLGDTLAYAQQVAPNLLNRTFFFLMQNLCTREMYLDAFVGHDQLLEKERRGELVQDTRPLLVPPSFGQAVAGLFPELYSRLYRGLPDKSLIPEAMKEVFVDFLVRWGATFQGLEPQHRVFLLELCDRTAARRASQAASEHAEEEPALLAQARKSRLLDAILKDVRDELAKLSAA